MTNEEAEAIEMLKSLVEVRRKYGDMQTMKDEIKCLDMGIKALEIFEQAKEAGFHGKEVEFYIGGRKFAIRELAQ